MVVTEIVDDFLFEDDDRWSHIYSRRSLGRIKGEMTVETGILRNEGVCIPGRSGSLGMSLVIYAEGGLDGRAAAT